MYIHTNGRLPTFSIFCKTATTPFKATIICVLDGVFANKKGSNYILYLNNYHHSLTYVFASSSPYVKTSIMEFEFAIFLYSFQVDK